MYGLIVKTSLGVWRLSFMSPHFWVGRHIVFAMAVYLSVTKSCPLCNLKPVQDILMERHKKYEPTLDDVQRAETIIFGYIYLFKLCPFKLCK